MARLLTPEDFGLVAFAIIIVTFIEAARGFGVNDALIYTSEDVDKAADTAFIINVVLGIAQFALAYALSPLLVNVFDDDRIVEIVRVISLVFVFNGFGQTHDALLQKELQFRKRFLPEIIGTVFKGISSIALAVAGFGVWSLVIGQLVGAATRTVAKWLVLRWWPRFRFYPQQARLLWNYGVQILLFEILSIALDQADQTLIGTMIGQVQLGYYSIGVRIPEMVIANFSLVLTRVLFPAYTKLKDNIAGLTNAFLATTKYTAFITVPAGFGMAAVAPELILVVYGPKWEESIILLQVLAFLGMVATLPWSAGDVLKALGRPDISTRLLMVEALYTFPMIYLFVAESRLAVMASLANLIALCITTVLRLYVTSRFLNINPLVFFKLFRSPFLSAGAMFAAVTLWRNALSGSPLVLILLTSIILGAIVYAALLWIMEKRDILSARDMLVSLMKNRKDEDDEDDEDSDLAASNDPVA
ncbi:MAG: lipopolysaccharide biosynthesis protein [Chloroflexi bacterium]|nr:lipopolysaccharide biosynthesis protein [Chloroflexota bacterium]